MKKINILFLIFVFLISLRESFSQSFSPKVIASSGNQVNVGGLSVSSTLGETFTSTLTSGNLMLTQGFQQPIVISLSISATPINCYGGLSTVIVSASGGVAPYSGTGTFQVSAGTYNYIVTDANGYSNSSNITITQPVAVSASSTSTAILCNGGASTVTVSATGGTAPYSGTGTFTEFAGQHTYIITDAFGCSNATSINIPEPSLLVASSSATAIACNGGNSTVTVTASNGTSPYSGTGIYNLTAGSYSYILSDANGCTATTSITITQPAKVEGTTSSVSASCSGNDGTATITPTGGVGGYTYLWSNSQTTQTATNLSPGTYSVVITDDNGCTGSVSAVVSSVGTFPETPGAISGPGGACRNQSGLVYSVSPALGATSYLWTLPTGATGSSTTNSITISFGSTYSGGFICVSAVNNCGTTLQSCKNIPVLTARPSQPTVLSGPSIICAGSIGTYSTTSANALSYTWTVTGAGVYIIDGQGTNTIHVNIPASFGQGSIQVYGTNCIGNSQTRGMTITGIPIHSNAVIGPSFVCANNSATYTMPLVNGATTYSWTTTGDITLVSSSQNLINSVASFNFGPSWTIGTISITVSNSCGSYTRTFTVRSVPDQPGGITGPGFAVCGLSNVTYSIAPVSSATSYSWSVPSGVSIVSNNGTSIVVNFNPEFTTTGNICVNAINNCGSGIQRCLAVTSRPAVPAISGLNTVCKSQSSVPYSIGAISGASSYAWSITGGALISPAGLTANVNYTSATNSSATIRVNAVNSCGVSQPGILNVSVGLFCRTASVLNEPDFNGHLSANPNPTLNKTTVTIKSSKNTKAILKVITLQGQILLTNIFNAVEGNNHRELELEGFAKGVYILNLSVENMEPQNIRLVVE
ncbi:MAG: T9SS type A sorting domain-containing protein [Bacteroidetes bacterium]|nr:T9SS type A sorting domain-containing protein [Bacteroidota bacterium]